LWLLGVLGIAGGAGASTITIVPVYEPLSLHGTDSDEISEIGETLRATIMARPMALSGAFPETLVEAVGLPHTVSTNTPNYKVTESNLLVLCAITVSAELGEEAALQVNLDVAKLKIPEDVDLTARQVLKLAILAVRRTLEAYQAHQPGKLKVSVAVTGTGDANNSLRDLAQVFTLGE
jgi:hypothetical protein